MTHGTVAYPELRSRLRAAAAAFRDDELHERLWLRGKRISADEWDFEDALLFIVDQLAAFDPGELVGLVLVNDLELQAFTALSSAMNSLLLAIGDDGTYADALNTGAHWQETVTAACVLERLLDKR
jgi:hypothetical protein